MNLTEKIFEAIIQNSEDLDMFLDLHLEFDEFYRRARVRFFNEILVPGLQNAIAAHNTEKPDQHLTLARPSEPEACLKKHFGSGLFITGEHWPDGYAVHLSTDTDGPTSLCVTVFVSPPGVLDNALAVNIEDYFRAWPQTYGWGHNNQCVWIHYRPELGDWLLNKEAIRCLLTDLSSAKNPNFTSSLAARYISDVMNLADKLGRLLACR